MMVTKMFGVYMSGHNDDGDDGDDDDDGKDDDDGNDDDDDDDGIDGYEVSCDDNDTLEMELIMTIKVETIMRVIEVLLMTVID